MLIRSVEEEIAAVQGHLAKLKANGCTVCIACECSSSSNTVHGRPDLGVGGFGHQFGHGARVVHDVSPVWSRRGPWSAANT
ncbi:hypothetical protein [Paracoccus mutanolyticus]|uniref:hypothetical protein n=1 Tax=Paracoccus mutanolyticus TaxID=1499308 RepID=UPI001CB9B783|nr:hypothetical protein [Paracoccus mutanolyticus]